MSDLALKIIEQAIKDNATFVDFGNCGLTAIPPEILNLPETVNHINFGPYYFFKKNRLEKSKYIENWNYFTESDSFNLLCKLINLRKLELYLCFVGDKGAESIGRLNQLTSLDISSNQIGDKGAESIGRLNQLTSLNISSNQIRDKGAESIGRLSQLTSLDISSNQIRDKGAASIGRLSQLTSLDIWANQIGDKGVKSIGCLSQLASLDISDNRISYKGAESIGCLTQLTSLEISDNQIGDKGAESIGRLSQLTTLDISSNKIKKKGAESIGDLNRLTSLYIYSNQIGDKGAESIKKLNQLTSLDISDNQISDKGAESVGQLGQLTSLEIADNKISDKGAKSISLLSQLVHLDVSYNLVQHASYFKELNKLDWLNLSTNKIRDVPESITEQGNCIADIRIWWKETEDEALVRPNSLVKLQVIGNGGAGKSSVIEALKKGVCQQQFQSTHGIIIEPVQYRLNDEDIQFQAWDFGGQEIYHGTHKLFIASQAIHLLVADGRSEQDALDRTKVPDRDNPEELVLHQPLQHYINMSKRQSPNSLRLIVKNKTDIKVLDAGLAGVADANNLALLPVSARTGDRIDALRKKLAGMREDILSYNMPMPVSWMNVQQHFMDNLTGHEIDKIRLMSMDMFRKVCKNHNVSDISVNALLNFLHHTGLVYKNEGILRDVIITDQKWALDAVYKPLDRKSQFYKELRNEFKGRVQVKAIFQAFGHEFKQQHKWLFLHFMRSCGLCFSLRHIGRKEDEESYYIFPEFLPEQETPAITALWKEAKHVNTFSYTPEFLEYHLIQGLIVELGNKTKIEHIWKNGILVDTLKGMFRVEMVANRTIQISIEEPAIDYYLWQIIETLNKGRNREEKIEWRKGDGQSLDINSLRRKELVSKEEKMRTDSEKKGAVFLKDTLPDLEQPSPKRLVISFTMDNIQELKDVEESLANYELNGALQIQYDDKLIDGTSSWDDKIQEMFLNADGYLILASVKFQNFKKHLYIWQKEMPIIEQRHFKEGVFAYCLPVGPVDYNERLKKFPTFRNQQRYLPENGHARTAYLIEFAKQIIEGKFLKKEADK